MASSQDAFELALSAHRAKLQGLTAEDARQAAAQGARLLVVAAAPRSVDAQSDELLFQDGQQNVWGCRASLERLLAWLNDDGVSAICADQLPDVRLSHQRP